MTENTLGGSQALNNREGMGPNVPLCRNCVPEKDIIILRRALGTLEGDQSKTPQTCSFIVSVPPPHRLNFQFCPSSKIHGFFAVDLKPNGDDEVTDT